MSSCNEYEQEYTFTLAHVCVHTVQNIFITNKTKQRKLLCKNGFTANNPLKIIFLIFSVLYQ